MSFSQMSCLFCNKVFRARNSDIKRGGGKYCSLICVGKNKTSHSAVKNRQPNSECAYCFKQFYRSPSKRKTKSGLVFCCRKHKDLAQKLNGRKEIHPSHYGTGTGLYNYRKRALEFYGSVCDSCGYSKYEKLLEVHHIDKDRNNNKLTNLRVLCIRCHLEQHIK